MNDTFLSIRNPYGSVEAFLMEEHSHQEGTTMKFTLSKETDHVEALPGSIYAVRTGLPRK